MCRLAAYLGPEISLRQLLLDPEHSLYRQSWEPKEMQEAKLNADGFGVGWYDDTNLATRYRNTQPIWSDPNLADLGRFLKRALWLATVRSATPGQGSGIDNTQPFVHNNILFMHNGYISEFATIKEDIIRSLDNQILAEINGNTDSEYLFALIKQQLKHENSITQALISVSQRLNELLRESSALLNMIISTGHEIYALKFAINATPPTLYYLKNSSDFNDAVIIASEPFSVEKNWEAIPEQQVFTVYSDLNIKLTPLHG